MHNVGLPCHPSQSPAAESLLIRGFNHPAGKSSLFIDNSWLYSPPWKVKRSSKLGWTFLNLPRLPLMNSIKNPTVVNKDQDQPQSTLQGKDHILLFWHSWSWIRSPLWGIVFGFWVGASDLMANMVGRWYEITKYVREDQNRTGQKWLCLSLESLVVLSPHETRLNGHNFFI